MSRQTKPKIGWGYCIKCQQWQYNVLPDPTLKTRLLAPQGVCEWCHTQQQPTTEE